MRTILETRRLLLREMNEADAHDVYLLNSSAAVMKYLDGEAIPSHQTDALEILRTKILPQYRLHGLGRWAVLLRDSGVFIGFCGLRYLPETDEYDLGYRFLERYWGNGYATESARAVLEYAREHLPGKRIIGKAVTENIGSIRVLEKIGLRFEAHREGHGGIVAVYVNSQDTKA